MQHIAHLPIALQREVYFHLTVLEFEKSDTQTSDIEMKVVREQYLKLAQKYHPDRSVENPEQAAANEAIFVKMKESFERLVNLDKESGG